MKIDLNNLLHPRIIDKSISLYKDGYFPQAAMVAMKQVEIAFKEKAGIEDEEKLFGVRLYIQTGDGSLFDPDLLLNINRYLMKQGTVVNAQ